MHQLFIYKKERHFLFRYGWDFKPWSFSRDIWYKIFFLLNKNSGTSLWSGGVVKDYCSKWLWFFITYWYDHKCDDRALDTKGYWIGCSFYWFPLSLLARFYYFWSSPAIILVFLVSNLFMLVIYVFLNN